MKARATAACCLCPVGAGACLCFPGAAVGYFLIQFQKRGVSNCFAKPGFGQRGQNSSPARLTSHWLVPATLVACVTKGGRIPVLRGGKKHHRFFGWIREYPLRLPPPLRTQDRPLPGRNTHSGRRRRLWINLKEKIMEKLKRGVLKAGGVSFIVGVTGIFLTVCMNKNKKD